MSGAQVVVDEVSKWFDPNQVVLDSVDMTVAHGEFVTILGASGCGKSTLLRIIAGIEVPSAGTVRIADWSPEQARREHRLAMAFQHAGLFEWRDTAANVDLPMKLAGWDAARRRQRVAELLDMVGLADAGRRKVWELSGGMQQRVALARALALEPEVLLLDEPFGALDELTRDRLQRELREVHRTTATTVIMVTHSVAEAVALGDRTMVMGAMPGRVVDTIDTSTVGPATPVEPAAGRAGSDDGSARQALEARARSALAAHL